MVRSYIKLILCALLFVGLNSFAVAQVSAVVTIANESSSGADYFFDIYIHEANGSSGAVYLGDSQFRLSFDNSKFTNPGIHQVSNPGSLFGQEDGYSTFIPTTTDGGFNDAITRNNYYNALSVEIPNGKPNILNIELNGPGPGNQTAFDTRVARIDDNQFTHRLGRYRISGYKGSGDPSITVVTSGSFATALLTYASTSPWGTSVVSLSSGALPVEWMSFTAEATEHQEVQLEWITGAEINNDRFVIEKKLKHGEFTDIGAIQSKGNSTNPQMYSFFDNTPMTNVVYYRIRQIDLDGTTDYSNTLEVKFEWGGDNPYVVFPSPAEDEITIETYIEEMMDHEFWILDLQGKEISNGMIEAGKAFQKVDITELSEGNYFIKVQGPNESIHHLKFMKKY
ncbi:MAG: T9SS type A sorting domain-containing protein [Bacteroidia bacterium]|nr:T9SS type A sorting domain-containing protein [Bacteroidia bacterium]